ncbi:MAG: GAF domain-containing protein [Deltaproteobacteria bacterium]|nr:GAF domain-containing protein [Deltaproteobacteria bacterium]
MLKLNPVHKFSLSSLFFILFLIISLGSVVSHYFKKIMLARESRITTDFVQAHARERLNPEDFSYPSIDTQQKRFARVFQDIAKMPEVVSVKVYDKDGTILWSNQEGLIGHSYPQNKELQEALKGKSVVVLEPLRRPDHAYLKGYHHNLLEVYVPIPLGSDNTPSGVLATYKASTALLGDIRTGKTVIWLVSITGGILLYFSLLGIFYRAHKAERRMGEGLRRLNQELSAFNKIAITLSKTLELDTLLKDTLDRTLEVLGMKAGWISLMDEGGNELTLAVHKGLPEEMVCNLKRIKVGEGILGEVMRTGEPIIRTGLSEDPGMGKTACGMMGSCASIPLKSMDRVLGVMEVMCPGCDCQFPLESYELFSAIGYQTGAAIAKSMLYKEVKGFKEHLEEMVEEKTRQVIQMEKLSTMGELMGEIAHQINNPLVGVVNFAQLALRKMDEDHPLREELETIKRAGVECREIIQRLLTFSRQSGFELTPVEINPLIDEALGLVERQFNLREITLEKRYGKGLLPIMLDAILMRQALFNIINNAREAMPDGGRLTVTTSLVNTIPQGSWIEIGISDTGAGIKEENLQKVFLPFFTTKVRDGGIGLGLSVVQDIIHRHRGEIRVESKEGAGTTFTIRLPV